MPQETKSKTPLETSDGLAQGARVETGDPQVLHAAIESAFHYRGDVTIERIGGGASVDGYIFDRRAHDDPTQASLRILTRGGGERITLTYAEVSALEFTGRDTAAGKSFETWMKKYVQKKLAGQQASIESESLDEE